MIATLPSRRFRTPKVGVLRATNRPIQTGHYGGVTAEYIRNRPAEQVFALGHGMGLDSMGMLVLLRDLGIRPQFVTFADTGNFEEDKPGEKPETYQYIPVLRQWLRDNGFPELNIVRFQPVRAKYTTLYENCIVNETLPSLAMGRKACSDKSKIKVQEKFMAQQSAVQACWDAGYKIIKAIGYDAGKADAKRGYNKTTGKLKVEDERYVYYYPLREFGWTRDILREKVVAEGLPGFNADNEQPGAPLFWVNEGGVPVKSACWFCPANRPHEVDRLAERHPHLAARGVFMEHNARDGKHGLRTVKGLGRSWSWGDRLNGVKLPVIQNQRHAMALCEACDG